MKKVLVISSSLRAHSNSEALARAFADGARLAGHEVQFESLKDCKIGFCRGCYACAEADDAQCVQHDDAPRLIAAMRDADAIAFASPVYFYGLAAQLKALLDRTVAIYGRPKQFTDIYLLMSAGEDDPSIAPRMVAQLQGWVECFPDTAIKGTIFAGGFQDAGTVDGTPAVKGAHDLGANI